ncbi:MAG: hypothetical protein AB2392_21770 [Neobacillus sp.]|uniref:hypothetical protein n=1 Tax=Cytobacillus gottheilii TaxID=859144 RepID=UPI00082A13AF|nr:hypothetical protein [Cytobacillus gottheilii]
MNKKTGILFAILLLFLTACSSETYIYSGETDNWSAELKVIQTSNDFETQELALRYVGEDVNSVGDINYVVESVGNFFRNGATLSASGTLSDKSESNPTNAKITKDTEIIMTIEWNDKKESFTLDKK